MRARIADCTTASDERRQQQRPQAGQDALSSQPGKPPAENQPSCTENSRISRMANQKLGMAMPTCVRPITPTSPSLLWREAA